MPKQELVFATGNPNKLEEVQLKLQDSYQLLDLKEIGILEEIPENEPTISGNAEAKMRYVVEKTGRDCFSDDTGLEVEALNGEPGVHSARYAGTDKDFEANIDKLLEKMQGISNRKARFITVIALHLEGKEYLFEGVVNGSITTERIGNKGFGYDSVFIPEGYSTSFAQMELSDKNKISHRGLAVGKLADFLQQYQAENK